MKVHSSLVLGFIFSIYHSSAQYNEKDLLSIQKKANDHLIAALALQNKIKGLGISSLSFGLDQRVSHQGLDLKSGIESIDQDGGLGVTGSGQELDRFGGIGVHANRLGGFNGGIIGAGLNGLRQRGHLGINGLQSHNEGNFQRKPTELESIGGLRGLPTLGEGLGVGGLSGSGSGTIGGGLGGSEVDFGLRGSHQVNIGLGETGLGDAGFGGGELNDVGLGGAGHGGFGLRGAGLGGAVIRGAGQSGSVLGGVGEGGFGIGGGARLGGPGQGGFGIKGGAGLGGAGQGGFGIGGRGGGAGLGGARHGNVRLGGHGQGSFILGGAGSGGIGLGDAELQGTGLNSFGLGGARQGGFEIGRGVGLGAGLGDAGLGGTGQGGFGLRGAGSEGGGLGGAEVQGAGLHSFGLGGTGLSGAGLLGVGDAQKDLGLRGARLNVAGLEGDKLSGFELRGAEFSRAGLEGAEQEGLILGGTGPNGAGLGGGSLGGFVLGGTRLSGAGLGGGRVDSFGLGEAGLSKGGLSSDLSETGIRVAGLGDIGLGGNIHNKDKLDRTKLQLDTNLGEVKINRGIFGGFSSGSTELLGEEPGVTRFGVNGLKETDFLGTELGSESLVGTGFQNPGLTGAEFGLDTTRESVHRVGTFEGADDLAGSFKRDKISEETLENLKGLNLDGAEHLSTTGLRDDKSVLSDSHAGELEGHSNTDTGDNGIFTVADLGAVEFTDLAGFKENEVKNGIKKQGEYTEIDLSDISGVFDDFRTSGYFHKEKTLLQGHQTLKGKSMRTPKEDVHSQVLITSYEPPIYGKEFHIRGHQNFNIGHPYHLK